MDLAKIPVLPFQLFLFGLFFVFLGGVFFYFPGFWEGALWSSFLQMHFFQGKFVLFRLWKGRSMTQQLVVLLISFFVNGGILLFFGVPKGSNFILGFFLAYFAFIGIFVLSAILSMRVASSRL